MAIRPISATAPAVGLKQLLCRPRRGSVALAAFCALLCSCRQFSFTSEPEKPLLVYFVDVEGGQATLFVTPAGESLLIDTGWDGSDGRDADRIVAAAKDAGLSKIDYVLIPTITAITSVASRN